MPYGFVSALPFSEVTGLTASDPPHREDEIGVHPLFHINLSIHALLLHPFRGEVGYVSDVSLDAILTLTINISNIQVLHN